MPLVKGDKENQLPVRGLNTEASSLDFPLDFCADILNYEPDYDPLRLRVRKGMTRSLLPRLADTRNVSDHDVAITSYLWENVGNDPDLNWVVVQVAEFLYFFDADNLGSPTVAVHSERFDLSTAVSGTSKGTAAILETTRVQFETIKGNLIVVAKPIDPLVIVYDSSGPSVSGTKLSMKKRDMQGLDSEIEVDKRPSAIGDFPGTVTASATYADISEVHEYNLYNQGWYKNRRVVAAGTYDDPIAKFNTDLSEYPSNADIVYLGMQESSGDLIFEPDLLKDQTFGSTPAPRGHYVVDIFDIDRETIRTTPDASGATTGGGTSGGYIPDDGIDFPPTSLP